MLSPRIAQISAANRQTIYAPVPPKENNQAKSIDFIKTHRIISSVTVDHVRDIRSLDQTSSSVDQARQQRAKAMTQRGRSPSLKKQANSVSFLIAGEESARASGLASQPESAKATKAEVRFATSSPSNRRQNRSGGYVLTREKSDLTSTSVPPFTTTPGRGSPAAHLPSPGPFYSPVRGTIRLSAHNRHVYTPNKVRQLGFAHANSAEDVEQRASSPVDLVHANLSPHNSHEPLLPFINDPSLHVHSALAPAFEAQKPEQQVVEVSRDEMSLDQAADVQQQQQPPATAPPKLKLPNRQHMENNVKTVINNAFLPRDNSGGWMFRQKWLRLFARNGANGLAYAYSSKLQNSYS